MMAAAAAVLLSAASRGVLAMENNNATTGVPGFLHNDTCVCYPVYVDGNIYSRFVAE